MASQTCIKNKSVPSEEAKATKKEAKARKKITQERIALGVKKLKLKPPVAPRPKPIIFCRHHLKGRCHEGEQCKFSHDTTPETKSLPCCYFATQSCMKGDDCPYDHDLSKYPCNNFVTKGFCHRGDTCLFSHKGTPQAASDRPVANVTTSSSNIAAASSSFEALNVKSGVKENDLSKNQEKMDSQTCIKNKSVPSKEAKARKKPCRYLATQSCMKGDDCPYDHDLLKYPCINFVTNGFCHMGDKCLFSHKAASDRPGENVTISSSNTAAASVLPQKSNKQTVRQAIARLQGIQPRVSSSSTFLKPSSQSNQKNSTVASSSKINEHATPPQLPPLRKPSVVPKGMSFLSFYKTTQEEDTSKKL
ncbi:zinc finger CCCH domain-containing protein 65-like [Raphanus sativus]|uniref:Zinc finger CCCH domain-containing protein 65-like n=1 Tax=Raphanus sativus TaxID=3726 RepID=A0A6J0MEL3_RAPSA|nr:zinc finger CCCH domain-containing protein 65-like [Raphanus sativus]